jgi:hypothetical protein
MVPAMTRSVLAAALLASSPALAAGLASRPADSWSSEQSDLTGIYAGLGGGGVLLIIPGDNTFGYDLELRVGYSFNPMLQVFLSGALDGGSFSGASFRTEQIVAFVQYHLFVKPALMVYGRAGIGVGLSRDVVPGSTAAGFAGAGGLGMEFRVAPNLFLAPEIFYRNANLSAQGTDMQVQVVGLQLGLVYY